MPFPTIDGDHHDDHNVGVDDEIVEVEDEGQEGQEDEDYEEAGDDAAGEDDDAVVPLLTGGSNLPSFLEYATMEHVVLCPVGETCPLDHSKRMRAKHKESRLKSINGVEIVLISTNQLRGWCSKMKIYDGNGKSMRKAAKLHICQCIVLAKQEYDNAKQEGREPTYSHRRRGGSLITATDHSNATTNPMNNPMENPIPPPIAVPTAVINRIRYANVLFGDVIKSLLLQKGGNNDDNDDQEVEEGGNKNKKKIRITDKVLHTAIANEYNTKKGKNLKYDKPAFTDIKLIQKYQPHHFHVMRHWQQSYDCFVEYCREYQEAVLRYHDSNNHHITNGQEDDEEEVAVVNPNYLHFDHFTKNDPTIKYLHRYVLQNPGTWEIIVTSCLPRKLKQQQVNNISSVAKRMELSSPAATASTKKKMKIKTSHHVMMTPSITKTLADAVTEGVSIYAMLSYNNEMTRLRHRKRELYKMMIQEICQGDRQLAKERWLTYQRYQQLHPHNRHDNNHHQHDGDNNHDHNDDHHSIDSQASLFEEMIECDEEIRNIQQQKKMNNEKKKIAAAAAASTKAMRQSLSTTTKQQPPPLSLEAVAATVAAVNAGTLTPQQPRHETTIATKKRTRASTDSSLSEIRFL